MEQARELFNLRAFIFGCIFGAAAFFSLRAGSAAPLLPPPTAAPPLPLHQLFAPAPPLPAAFGGGGVSGGSAVAPLSPPPQPPPPPSPSPPAPLGAVEAGLTGALDAQGFATSVDGVEGPKVRSPWIPRRTTASLSLGTADGRSAALVVDNWFGSHHGGGGADVTWSELSLSEPLVGVKAERLGRPRAPPLPLCAPLSPGGGLQGPLVGAAADALPDFPGLAALSQTGADAGGWVASVGTPAVEGVSDPHTVTRALPWHRLAHVEARDFLGLDSPEAAALLYASMTARTRERFCAAGGRGVGIDFLPRQPCDPAAPLKEPSTRYPYCNRGTAPVSIVSIDCAVVENGAYNSVIVLNVISFDAGGTVVSYNNHRPHAHPRWKLPPELPVREEFAELAVAGTSVYPNAPGHFFNEILPRLLHMDTVLPLHIPLMWPPGALPARTLDALRENGLLSEGRRFVTTNEAPELYRAQRLYLYASDYNAGHTPLILATSQRVLAARLQALVVKKDAALRAAGGAPEFPLHHGGIVVLLRNPGDSRTVVNGDEMIQRLKQQHPSVPVVAFVPGSSGRSYVEVASIVYGAKVIIGPHGGAWWKLPCFPWA